MSTISELYQLKFWKLDQKKFYCSSWKEFNISYRNIEKVRVPI